MIYFKELNKKESINKSDQALKMKSWKNMNNKTKIKERQNSWNKKISDKIKVIIICFEYMH